MLARLTAPLMGVVQRTRADQFATLGGVPDGIVFLGDSITEGGLWSDWFPDAPASHRGVGGVVTAQMLARLSSTIPPGQ